MNMKRIIWIPAVVALTLSACSQLRAADLGVAPLYKAPAPVPAAGWNWTGVYGGLNFGGGWEGGPVDLTGDPINTKIGRLPASIAITPASVNAPGKGVLGGATLGGNVQIDSFVLGVEGDFDWSDMKGSFSEAWTAGLTVPPFKPVGPFSLNTMGSTKLDWLSTVRGRVGFALTPHFMVYGTGGAAFGDASVSASSSVTGPGGCLIFCGGGTTSATKTGWAYGGGIEYAVTQHWLVKAEYLHYDLGTISGSYVTAAPLPLTVNYSTKVDGDIGRVGAAYKF